MVVLYKVSCCEFVCTTAYFYSGYSIHIFNIDINMLIIFNGFYFQI